MKRILELVLAALIGAGASTSYAQLFFGADDPPTNKAGQQTCGGSEDHPCFMKIVGIPMVRTACGESTFPCNVEISNARPVEVSGDVRVYDGYVTLNNVHPLDVRVRP